MKTSVIQVHDMLSVLSVVGVEKRIGEVPGVESVTVNYDAGNATVRYDETRLDVADIKSAVRQRAHESDDFPPEHADEHKPDGARVVATTPVAAPPPVAATTAAAPKAVPVVPAAVPGVQSPKPVVTVPTATAVPPAVAASPTALPTKPPAAASAPVAPPPKPAPAPSKAPPPAPAALRPPAAPGGD